MEKLVSFYKEFEKWLVNRCDTILTVLGLITESDMLCFKSVTDDLFCFGIIVKIYNSYSSPLALMKEPG